VPGGGASIGEALETHRSDQAQGALDIEHLKLWIVKLQRMRFGRKSEKISRQIEQLEYWNCVSEICKPTTARWRSMHRSGLALKPVSRRDANHYRSTCCAKTLFITPMMRTVRNVAEHLVTLARTSASNSTMYRDIGE